jgi:intergrase/recombinase
MVFGLTPWRLRCQGYTVRYYGFTYGRLGSGAYPVFVSTGVTRVLQRLDIHLNKIQLITSKGIYD